MGVLGILKIKCCRGYCYDILELGKINLLKKNTTNNSVPLNDGPGPSTGCSWSVARSRVFAGKTFSGKLRVTPLHHHGATSTIRVSVLRRAGRQTMARIHCHCQPRPLTPSALTEAIHPWIAQRTAAMQLPNRAKVANAGRGLEL